MGHYSGTTNAIVQIVRIGVIAGSFGSPAYFNNWIYYQRRGDRR